MQIKFQQQELLEICGAIMLKLDGKSSSNLEDDEDFKLLTEFQNNLPFKNLEDFLQLETLLGDEANKKILVSILVVEFYIGLFIKNTSMVDQYLRWDVHIDNTCNKLKHWIYKFRNISQFSDKEISRLVYVAYIQSYLQYGIKVWGGTFSNHMEKIFSTFKNS
jgi:hypothetical protein